MNSLHSFITSSFQFLYIATSLYNSFICSFISRIYFPIYPISTSTLASSLTGSFTGVFTIPNSFFLSAE